jgi:hypothetical protein
MSEDTEHTEEKKGLKAKSASLWGQIVGAVWIGGWGAYKLIQEKGAVDVKDIILLGLAIAACFVPVYFNMIMDKLHDIIRGA